MILGHLGKIKIESNKTFTDVMYLTLGGSSAWSLSMITVYQ